MRTLRTAVLSVLLAASLAGCAGEGTPDEALSDPPLASATPEPEPEPSEEPVGPPRPTEAQLPGDGIFASDEVLEFGRPVADVRRSLEGEIGKASRDSGVQPGPEQDGPCATKPLQTLEFGGGALAVMFRDLDGKGLVLSSWTLTSTGDSGAVPQANAFVGDVATLDFGVGTTVRELQEGTATDTFVTRPAADGLPAGFTLMDQSLGFTGTLTGTSPTDTVTSVSAGEDCEPE